MRAARLPRRAASHLIRLWALPRSEPPLSPEVEQGYRRQLEALDSLIHSRY